MKFPYITISKNINNDKLVIGFAKYNTTIKGCVLWCDNLKRFIKMYKYC